LPEAATRWLLRIINMKQGIHKVIILIPGYAEWSGPGRQRASGTVTLIKGRTNVIVDTGVPSQKKLILKRLGAAGVTPDDIKYVVITHGQSDHVGNNNLFPRAKFILDTDVSVGDEYSVHDFHEDAFHIDDGIWAIATPGHTEHDISVVVETEDGTVAIAGDIFEKEGDWQDRSWEAWSKKPEEQRKSREKLLRIAQYIVPGHGEMFRVPPLATLQLSPGRQDIEQQEAFFRKHDALITELARKFQTHWSRIDEDKIKNWLRQFGDYRSITSVFPLLQNIDYIDDGKIIDLFTDFYEKLGSGDLGKVAFARLGGGKDSTSLIGYLCSKAFSEKQRHDVRFDNLEALARTTDPASLTVVFLDDTIGSGNQSVSIFKEWLGLSDGAPRHVHRLSSDTEQWLRKARLVYFALIGFREGKEQLADFLASQDIAVRVHTAITMDESIGCFDASSLIFDNPQVRLHAKKIVEEIGFQLFSDQDEWSDEKRRGMSLGYRGAQKLIVFSYNTPNCTVPILWKKGQFNGKEWLPLFPRRD
jgi:glyoxylase-like metal-dependent hydrolase (beta-lactamase superfamily II)